MHTCQRKISLGDKVLILTGGLNYIVAYFMKISLYSHATDIYMYFQISLGNELIVPNIYHDYRTSLSIICGFLPPKLASEVPSVLYLALELFGEKNRYPRKPLTLPFFVK